MPGGVGATSGAPRRKPKVGYGRSFFAVSAVSDGEMKQMAELLRSGATMLSYSCPECASPLFRLKTGEVWCARCERRVVIVPEGEEAKVEAGAQLDTLERAIVDKLASMSGGLARESDPESIKAMVEVMEALLASLERLRKIRKT